MLLLMMACAGDEPNPHITDDTAPTPDTADSADTDTTDTTDTTDSGEPAGPMIDALCINELMPDNKASLLDEDGGSPDWIELHNPGDEAVLLDGWRITDDDEDPDLHTLSGGLTLEPGGFLLLYADDDPDAGADHLGLALAASGGMVGLFAPDDSGQIIRYGSVEEDFSVARQDDCCIGSGCLIFDFRGTPGTTNNPPEPVTVEVFPLGSTWRYLDTDVAPGAGWTAADFDDSAWAEGPGPLGFGDTHQVTIVSGGTDSDRTPTIYFRRTFTLTQTDIVGLTLDLMRDDGALVWLNGQEALRSNLPSGEITHETFASSAIGSPNEDIAAGYSADPALLVEGLNVLAVEVHQAAATSSDLTFDLGVSIEVLK
jgi:hypothetical protein